VLGLDGEHDLVESGQCPADVLAEGDGQVGGVAPCLGEAQAALFRRIDRQATPQDDENSCPAGEDRQAESAKPGCEIKLHRDPSPEARFLRGWL
jgi:hypothetical protein